MVQAAIIVVTAAALHLATCILICRKWLSLHQNEEELHVPVPFIVTVFEINALSSTMSADCLQLLLCVISMLYLIWVQMSHVCENEGSLFALSGCTCTNNPTTTSVPVPKDHLISYELQETKLKLHTQGLQSGYFNYCTSWNRFTCYSCTSTAADGEH